MIIRYRGVGKTVKLRKLVYIVPYFPVVGVENMRSILVYMNALYILRVNITGNVRPLVDHQHGFSMFFCLMSKHRPVKSCSYYQIIVHDVFLPSKINF